MKKELGKAYAKIDGVIQEYDIGVLLDDPVTRIPPEHYDCIGVGIVDSVCNIKTVGSKKMRFYKKKPETKKRKFGW